MESSIVEEMFYKRCKCRKNVLWNLQIFAAASMLARPIPRESSESFYSATAQLEIVSFFKFKFNYFLTFWYRMNFLNWKSDKKQPNSKIVSYPLPSINSLEETFFCPEETLDAVFS